MKALLIALLLSFQLFAVTSGSYTVGSGGDYANWAAAVAATEALTGNLTFTQISDVTDNTAMTLNVALGGYTLTWTSNKRHNGNFGGGWKTTLSMALNGVGAITVTNSSTSAGAKIVIDGLNIIYTGTTAGNFQFGLTMTTATTNISNTISNCIINANGKIFSPFRVSNANAVVNMYNCIAVNGITSSSSHLTFGINVNGIHTSSLWENNTTYNFTGAFGNVGGVLNYSNTAISIKNAVSLGNTKDFTYGATFIRGTGAATAAKCASSDTSGSEAGLKSLTDTAQFQSVTLTDGDTYLKIKSTGILDDGGVAPSIVANTTGIRGTARPHDVDKYSVGADEFKSTRPSVVITTSIDTFSDNTPFTATVTFSEDVTGLDSSEVTATNCTKTGFSGSGSIYTYTITPTGTDDIVISAPENIAIDLYSNGNTAATDKSVIYVSADTTRPTVSITSRNTHNGTSAFSARVTFSEDVTGFTVDSMTSVNATLSSFTGSGAVYNVSVTPTDTADITLSIAENKAYDEAGNGNVAAPDKVIEYVTPVPSTGGTGAKRSFKNYDRHYKAAFKNY